MRYQISHQTTYNYSQTVRLKPHIIRLCPRSDRFTQVQQFSLLVQPQPQGTSELIDLDGNNLIKLWFEQPTTKLQIQILSQVETLCSNPFNYLLEPWAITIPFDYPLSWYRQLHSYLQPYGLVRDAVALELAQQIQLETNNNTLNFLFTLNQQIYQECQYIVRETGAPWAAGITWKRKQGSCRDYSVLFMEVARSVGIPARFVSGYQEGDPDMSNRDLHGWVEVYLPGGGWRGYDPTLGLVVSDRHIPLVASAIPQETAPILGAVTPVDYEQHVTSNMDTQIAIALLK